MSVFTYQVMHIVFNPGPFAFIAKSSCQMWLKFVVVLNRKNNYRIKRYRKTVAWFAIRNVYHT